MTLVRREIIATDQPFSLLWRTGYVNDILSSSFASFDWAVARREVDEDGTIRFLEGGNRGGLGIGRTLETAIILCLFTDKRLPPEAEAADRRRGWHGDFFDIVAEDGERQLGSFLWTLERNTLNDDTARQAKYFALESLQALIDQGIVAFFDVQVEMDRSAGMMALHVRALDKAAQPLFSGSFPLL